MRRFTQPLTALEGGRLRRQLRIERAPIRFDQIVERLLQRLGMDVAQERKARFEFKQSFAKRFAPDRQRVARIVPEPVLGENRIPDQTRTAETRIPAGGSQDHYRTSLCQLVVILEIEDAPYIPGLKAEALRRIGNLAELKDLGKLGTGYFPANPAQTREPNRPPVRPSDSAKTPESSNTHRINAS